MENGRLLHFLQRLEQLSLGTEDPADNAKALQNVHQVVQTMRAELGPAPEADRTSHRSMPSFADTRLSVESVEAVRSGMASTVGLDHPVPPPASGLGFIDAIRLAAQSVADPQETSQPATQNIPKTSEHDALFALPPSKPDSPASAYTEPASSSSLDHTSQRSVHSDPPRSHPSSYTSPSSRSYNSDKPATPSIAGFPSAKVTRRMKYFRKYFPAYRKLFRHETNHRSFLRPKGQTNFSPAISPDTRHMALVSESKYQIFIIPTEYNERPVLQFTGDIEFPRSSCLVAMNNMWLVAASPSGLLVVVCLKTGRKIFSKNLRLQVTALEVSSEGSYIGVAVTKHADTGQQPMIFLICTSTAIAPESAFEHPDIVSFASPYNDRIRTIAFNDGETAVICSTEQESRVFVVSLEDYREPRILVRSRRSNNSDSDDGITSEDAEKQPEGVTGAIFLPNNRYVLLSSCAPGAPPVILDTRLVITRAKSHTGKILQYLNPSGQQQNVIIRFDKMGSAIQCCTASPQGNAAAFVDYSGAVFAVNFPNISTEARKIAVVFDLAAGPTIESAPVLRFSPDGTALLAVDRKGDIHIADFGAGHPQQPGIMRTKVLS